MLLSAGELAAPPIPKLPTAAARIVIGTGTFADASARSARFDVEWNEDGAAPTLIPRSPGASECVADAATAARLAGIADALALLGSDGPNRIGRLTFSLDEDAFVAARLMPRVERVLDAATGRGSGASDAADLVQTGAAQLRRQDPDAEFLSRSDEIVIGPEASQTLLGVQGDGSVPAATPTRATYVLRHELAHAAQPVDANALSEQSTHVFEEGRADLVARSDARLPEFARRLGLAFDSAALAADRTYPFQRDIVGMLLTAGGIAVGSAESVQLLASTPGERLPDALAGAIAARVGGDPASLAVHVRTSSSSLAAMRQFLTVLGLRVV